MRLGIGLGLFKAGLISAGVRIFSAFQTRVIGDGGTVEAGTCVVNGINGSALLQQASLLLIPSGYKGGKLYAEIPTNGNGDLTWTRTSTANRTNSSGLLESMATGVPRLSYMYGSCPAVLLEPQRTNLALRSEEFDNLVYTAYNTTVTANTTTAPDGNTTADSIAFGAFSDARVEQVRTGSYANNTLTISVFAKVASGTNTFRLKCSHAGVADYFSSDLTATTSWQRFSFTTTFGSTAGAGFVAGVVNTSSASAKTLQFWGLQVEVGAYPTTYIPTTSATATRVADSFSRNNIYTNGLISASGGTWFVELRNNISYVRDGISRFGIGDTSAINLNSLHIGSLSSTTTRQQIYKTVAGSYVLLYTTLTDTVKIAIKWNGTSADVFVNGTKVVSATSFTTTNMELLKDSGGLTAPTFIQQMALFPTPLSDTDCTTITSL